MSFAELDAFSASIVRFILSKNYGPEPAVGGMCRRGGRSGRHERLRTCRFRLFGLGSRRKRIFRRGLRRS
jgi:hypothetical protein